MTNFETYKQTYLEGLMAIVSVQQAEALLANPQFADCDLEDFGITEEEAFRAIKEACLEYLNQYRKK